MPQNKRTKRQNKRTRKLFSKCSNYLYNKYRQTVKTKIFRLHQIYIVKLVAAISDQILEFRSF